MDRSRVSKQLLKFITVVVLSAVGCLANDPARDKSSDGPPSCPQEMCVFLFDRIEEQSIRLRNIEDTLLRVVSILASAEDQEFSATSAALKSDPLLNSLLTADAYDSVDPIILFSDQVSSSLESPVKGIQITRGLKASCCYASTTHLRDCRILSLTIFSFILLYRSKKATD